jgi:glutamyl/glutaminyl-tRNA synthetase
MHEMNWINHLEFIVLLVTLIGGFYLLDAKIERQSDRTDKLYEMFIDLLKEGKK